MATAISDRTLAVLGILLVKQDQDGGILGSYAPFAWHCLARSADAVVSTPELQKSLSEDWGLSLPQAVVNQILALGERQGLLSVSNGVYKRSADLADKDLGAVKGEVERRQRELFDGVEQFAKEQFDLDWTHEHASNTLHSYAESFSSRILASAVTGAELPGGPPESNPDRYVIHRFAVHVGERNQQLFEDLLVLVKGRMLADYMYFLSDDRPQVPSLGKVEVYLDGPILLYVLGFAGTEIQNEYTEMLEMLKRQDAIVRCFEHSVTEAREILDAAAGKAHSGQASKSFHGDVVSFLVRSGKSAAEIEALSNRLPNDLLAMVINPVDTPPRIEKLQSDEAALGGRLQKRLGYLNQLARDRDIDSLTAIYRLRRGRSYRELDKCKAIFVTHNFNLFRVATEFFRTSDRRAISPCAHDAAITTMLWLQEPGGSPDLPRDRVIGDAYAALNPKAELWTKYYEEIERLRNASELDEEDAIFLRYGREAQEALMDQTMGNPEAFTAGTISQVLERSRENARREADERADTAEGKAGRAAGRLRGSRTRVLGFGLWVGRFAADVLLLAVGALIIIGLVFGPVGPINDPFVPGWLQAVAAALTVVASAVTMFFRPTILDYRDSVATRIGDFLGNLGVQALRLDERPDEDDDETRST